MQHAHLCVIKTGAATGHLAEAAAGSVDATAGDVCIASYCKELSWILRLQQRPVM